MIGSTLVEQKAAALFLFSSIETGLFRVERALPTPGQRQQTNLDPFDGSRCQRIVGKHLSIYNNRVSMDEDRKSGFYPDEPII